jgi:predicted RNA binding protein YcfA (HicA-like mRNA interferase family)
MGKLRVLSGREVCRILQQHGFVEVRRRGSHIVMVISGFGENVTGLIYGFESDWSEVAR